MAGPASRSRLASRFHKIRGQRTDGRPDDPSRQHLRPNSRSRRQTTRAETFCSLFSVLRHLHLVGLGRFERPTSRLSGVRSNQLSYRPKIRDQRTDDRGQTRRSGALAPTLEPVCSLISVLCPLIWKGCVDGGPDRLFQTTDDRATDDRQGCLSSDLRPLSSDLRKEVIQPQVPLRLPCYDFTPVADLTVDGCLPGSEDPGLAHRLRVKPTPMV